MAKNHIKHRPKVKRGTRPISPEARRLIRIALRRCKGSQRGAARLLGLANNLQLMRMLRGEMAETPAMHAAVIRARERARRAFAWQRPQVPQVDLDRMRELLKDTRWLIEVLEHML